MPKLHWTQRPENRDRMLANAARGGQAAAKKKKHIPWQHKPENREKALAQAANARKAKQSKSGFATFIEKKMKTKVIDYGNHLSEQLKTLTANAKARIAEIAEEINALDKERRNLVSAFNLRDMATVDSISSEKE